MTEQELAAIVVEGLRVDCWDVYQEVTVWPGGPIADIVAVRDPVVQVVECKTCLSAAVVGQADEWIRYQVAHFVTVAVPMTKRQRNPYGGRSTGRAVLARYMKVQGIGLFQVNGDHETNRWRPDPRPRLIREPYNLQHLRSRLTEKHKDWAPAGNADGKRWTPFTETVHKLKRVVRDNPGIALTDAIRELKEHHYASDQSARASLANWIRAGKIKGLEAEGRRCRLTLAEGPSNNGR